MRLSPQHIHEGTYSGDKIIGSAMIGICCINGKHHPIGQIDQDTYSIDQDRDKGASPHPTRSFLPMVVHLVDVEEIQCTRKRDKQIEA